MAALLVGMSIMAILMSAALPVWSHMAKREREEELIWRGRQYARAVGLFQRKYANTYPPTLDILVDQKFLRKKYKDPITQGDFQLIPAGQATQPGPPGRGGQQGNPQMPPTGMTPTRPLGQLGGQPSQLGQPGQSGQGENTFGQVGVPSIGIAGVVSKSKDTSIKIYNGRTKYNEWAFVYVQTAQRIGPGGAPGSNVPGGRGNTGPGRGGVDSFGMTPGMTPGMSPGGRGRPPVPGQFGQPPFGQPGQGQPGQPPPFRGPGQLGPPGPFVPQPQRPPVRPPGL
jgi:type II secretory pathway pseudopilin PulG